MVFLLYFFQSQLIDAMRAISPIKDQAYKMIKSKKKTKTINESVCLSECEFHINIPFLKKVLLLPFAIKSFGL
jgi:hypothetical protein